MNIPALHEYFIEQSQQQQKLGVVDCVQFVTGAVFAGWGRDYRDVLQYSDRRSAVTRLRQLGGLKEACVHALGEITIIDDLEPGDVIWYDKPATLGVLMPGYVAVKMGRSVQR